MEGTEAMSQFKALSNRYAWKKEQVRYVFDDPLIRNAVYRVLEAERQKEFEFLKVQIKQKRNAFYSHPSNRKLTKREWVGQQALKQDQAAISCLRGWSYRYKRHALTPPLSENAIVYAVADDTKPYNIQGYEKSVSRDGTIQYKQDSIIQIQDKGSRLEIADPYAQNGLHIVGAMVLAVEKSGEKMLFSGDAKFVETACDLVPWFNEQAEKPMPLIDTRQRVMAGYDKSEVRDDKFVVTHRIVDEEIYLTSRQRDDVNENRERHDLKTKRNTHRPR